MTARHVRPMQMARAAIVAALFLSCAGCNVTSDHLRPSLLSWNSGRPSNLAEAEQKIDELDRILSSCGTISVKIPDVWGQDRLAKFRSEYELAMAKSLETTFEGEINASVRHTEIESVRLQAGAAVGKGSAKTPAPQVSDLGLASAANMQANNDASINAMSQPSGNGPAALEPTVILDEHSNYLNHLNQLRRINAGDDLADRPGYGLYLVRIPVTLSPGPQSRRGKGAVITVSARSVMAKHTVRNALRNAVINETTNNLTQALCDEWTRDGNPTAGPGAGAFSLVSFTDIELFYGKANIIRLKEEAEHQLAKDLGDEPHHRSARVAEWIRAELEGAYPIFERGSAPRRSADLAAAVDPLEVLADHVSNRDFAKIALMQPQRLEDSQIKQASAKALKDSDDSSGRRISVVNTLSFALGIQAAGISRRLKQDMADLDPALSPELLKKISFFEPEVTDQAFRAFQEYVNIKWPLRVYAIEPVIAQQNVADSVGRRRQSALNLVAEGPAGLTSALAGIAAERRASDDEAAIRLNPTMVGFGAGRSTFGWIFYPRLQASRTRDHNLVADAVQIANGSLPDPMGDDQMIEPGQRECTALIEMPNFCPKIEFVTVATWFKNSDVGQRQKTNLETASLLGRMLADAEKCLARVKIDGVDSSEEFQVASERLEQLKDMMPTQRLAVLVPSSGDHNDSRIFCSQGLQLRPSLTGWHGKPPVSGEESTIFLEGNNFSVHDTHVIAGGKSAKSVLISRHLLEVTIPKDATPTPGADGAPLLNLNIATPNGVSNHILIETGRADARQKSSAGKPPPPPGPFGGDHAAGLSLGEGDPRPHPSSQ